MSARYRKSLSSKSSAPAFAWNELLSLVEENPDVETASKSKSSATQFSPWVDEGGKEVGRNFLKWFLFLFFIFFFFFSPTLQLQ